MDQSSFESSKGPGFTYTGTMSLTPVLMAVSCLVMKKSYSWWLLKNISRVPNKLAIGCPGFEVSHCMNISRR